MKKFRVMVFPCGAENALEINDALKYHVDVEVWGGSSIHDHGSFAYSNYEGGIPNISEPDFIEKFNAVLEKHDINYVIPTHDTVTLFFSQNQDCIKAKIVSSDMQTALICRNKKMTYDLFKDHKFCPAVFDNVDLVKCYPVFVKPNIGEGGKNTSIVYEEESLRKLLNENDDLLVLEYLPGEELTIDCFTNSQGELLFIGPRTRNRIKIGISFRSESVELSEEIKRIAFEINEKVNFKGLWFFQLKKDINGAYKLLEISTRCAGTMALYRQRGINFPLLSLMDCAGVPVTLIDNGNSIILDRRLKATYAQNISYNYVYIDFDDTIILDNKVNIEIMKFLYQCKNQTKKIILLTRHEKVIHDSLKEYNICEALFEEIIPLTWEQTKADKITEASSIFIDNSFLERAEVRCKKNIPVFDVDAVESLMI